MEERGRRTGEGIKVSPFSFKGSPEMCGCDVQLCLSSIHTGVCVCVSVHTSLKVLIDVPCISALVLFHVNLML